MNENNSLPSEQDINVYDSLDEKTAVQHFLGKDLQDAEVLFRDSLFIYHEDLMSMGPVAFCFYVRAYINYLRSDFSLDDCHNASAFRMLLDYRLDTDPDDISSVIPVLLEAVEYMIANMDKFSIFPDIDGNLAEKYAALRDRLIEHAR